MALISRRIGVASVLILLLGVCSPIEGATWLVDGNQATSGDGKTTPFNNLQDALAAAAAGDTIQVASFVYTGTRNTLLDFGGKSNIAVVGTAPTATVIDCAGSVAAFQIGSGSGYSITGFGFKRCPSAVSIATSSITLTNCIFNDNQGSSGGAIRGITSQITVKNCEFNRNRDSAIHVKSSSSIQITGSRFSNNIQNTEGGGITAISSSNVTITSSFFFNNQMAVYQDSGSLTVTGNSFYANSSPYTIQCKDTSSVSQSGNSFCGSSGNLMNCSGWTELPSLDPYDGCSVCNGNNQNKDCAGICFGNSVPRSPVCPPPTPFYVSPGSTGGNGSKAKPFGSLREALDATQYYKQEIILKNGSYTGANNIGNFQFPNKVVNIHSEYNIPTDVIFDCLNSIVPGFVFLQTNIFDATISGITIQNCRDAGFQMSGSGITLSRVIFQNNIRSGGGAGMFLLGSFVTIRNSQFINNRVGGGQGGALKIAKASGYPSTVTITGTRFHLNQASADGGAIWTDSACKLSVASSFFQNNTVSGSGDGGAVWIDITSTMSFRNSYWYANNKDVIKCVDTDPLLDYSNNSFCGPSGNTLSCGTWAPTLNDPADTCGVCGNANPSPAADCNGDCFGYAERDRLGGCCHPKDKDCAGICNGEAIDNNDGKGCCVADERDKCGVCGGTGECCVPDCAHGLCQNGRCNCGNTGYYGDSCELYDCNSAPCLHNGTCDGPNHCDCTGTGHSGTNCGTVSCTGTTTYTCYNGGTCGSNDKCNCPTGYLPPDCLAALCDVDCQHGTGCNTPNVCDCSSTGYTYKGTLCSEPVCSPSCQNGGVCIDPGTCDCGTDYSGDRCQDAVFYSGQVSLQYSGVSVLLSLVFSFFYYYYY